MDVSLGCIADVVRMPDFPASTALLDGTNPRQSPQHASRVSQANMRPPKLPPAKVAAYVPLTFTHQIQGRRVVRSASLVSIRIRNGRALPVRTVQLERLARVASRVGLGSTVGRRIQPPCVSIACQDTFLRKKSSLFV